VQECDAYFFCLEDRALLCRSCDVAVHTANAFVSAHRRFLLTGVQVGQELESDDLSREQQPEASPPPPPSKSEPAPPPPPPLYNESDFGWAAGAGATGSLADWSAVEEEFGSPAPCLAEAAPRATPKRSPRAPPAFGAAGQGRVAGGVMDWPLGEFFRGVSDFNGGGFSFGESGTSKVSTRSSVLGPPIVVITYGLLLVVVFAAINLTSSSRQADSSGKLGGSAGGSPYYRSSSEDRDAANELFGQVPEIQWSVPALPSPPTASGLHWQHGGHDSNAFVPDICSPDGGGAGVRCFPTANGAAKRQRNR